MIREGSRVTAGGDPATVIYRHTNGFVLLEFDDPARPEEVWPVADVVQIF